MRKVGATSSGSVIIEMTHDQYEALQLVVAGKKTAEEDAEIPERQEFKAMAVKRKLDHVRNCILKLKPSTLEDLMRSIRTIHPFTGGFAEKEIEHLLKILVREGLFTITEKGRVHYQPAEIELESFRLLESRKPAKEESKAPLVAD